ncbi:dihydrofolate reductase-like domain-containing protein [Podospora didyma]|uniref:Dihydrofolate reductase n=1 Tax=Podospora didyma TaxID=330526 RepID=A0AAE0KG96_9PEZI|nr:dihydrofolate reductase-like domain-containing protein [Podospora didyma]
MSLPLELTLVLAATRDMGIGLNGALPWTGLKKEMAYFARITKRIMVPQQQQQHSSSSSDVPPGPALNAVIMGRKTWDSIPSRFRPLKGRLNIVISRSAGASNATAAATEKPDVVMAGSLEQALAYLHHQAQDVGGGCGRVFVIGGAQIYAAALALHPPAARRILLTGVLSDFTCDTFFPLKLGVGGDEEEKGWKRSSKAALDEWVGEDVPQGVQEENGTRYEFQMWERVD